MFFHKFFSRKHEKDQAKAGKAEKRKGKRHDMGSDGDNKGDVGADEGSQSDADEAEIWQVSLQLHSVVVYPSDDLSRL